VKDTTLIDKRMTAISLA